VHLTPVAAGVDAVVDLGDRGRGDRRRAGMGVRGRVGVERLDALVGVRAGGAAVEARPVTAGVDGGLVDRVHVAR